jgi:hypothetical protein
MFGGKHLPKVVTTGLVPVAYEPGPSARSSLRLVFMGCRDEPGKDGMLGSTAI